MKNYNFVIFIDLFIKDRALKELQNMNSNVLQYIYNGKNEMNRNF